MGQSITIACPSTWSLTAFTGFLETLAYDESAVLTKLDHQLEVVAKDARWKLIVNEVSDTAAFVEEYASNDDLDERFRREVGSLRFFIVRFDDVGVTRRVLRSFAKSAVGHGESAWIDTDYGWVIHAWEFLKRTERDALWDWRRAPDEN